MGRDKPKKYNKMNYQQKSVYHDKQAKKYGINKDDFNTAQGGGGGRYDNINQGAYEKAIQNAMRNDFDYRTSAQHMDGVKGEANFDDFVKYERGAQKLHRQAGNEGDYSSNKDITTVTNNLVNDYRSNLTDTLTANEQQSQAEKGISEPSTPSPEMSEARERVENFDNIDYGVYGSSESGDNKDQRTNAANSFLDKYKLDVKSGANFKPTI